MKQIDSETEMQSHQKFYFFIIPIQSTTNLIKCELVNCKPQEEVWTVFVSRWRSDSSLETISNILMFQPSQPAPGQRQKYENTVFVSCCNIKYNDKKYPHTIQ